MTILVVSTVISPIISKTEERKYNALRFFLSIPLDQVKDFISKCEECMRMEEESGNNGKRMRNVQHENVDSDENKDDISNDLGKSFLKYSMDGEFSMLEMEDITMYE